VVGLLLLICACAAWLFLQPARVLVPSVVGLAQADASERIAQAGLTVVTQTREVDQPAQDGKVLTQTPSSATPVPRMSVVTITIGKGPEGPSLPDLTGKTRSDAEDTLLRLGLKVKFEEARSESVPIGRVIAQKPAPGEKILPRATVTLTISGGLGEIEVPDLANLSLEEARAVLDRAGLSLDVAKVAQEDFRPGDPVTVLRQEPAAGQTLGAGARVTVFIPIAPPVGGGASPDGASASHAPRFEGLTVAEAKKLAAEQSVALEFADAADESRVVTFQEPPPGDPLSPGSSVIIRVSEAAVVPNLSGLSESQARAEVEKAGLSVGTIKKSRGEVPGEVLDQRPSPGIEAVSGSAVDLVVSDPDAPPSAAQGPSATPGFTPAPWVE
jgi:serine/threonine-protein kinase